MQPWVSLFLGQVLLDVLTVDPGELIEIELGEDLPSEVEGLLDGTVLVDSLAKRSAKSRSFLSFAERESFPTIATSPRRSLPSAYEAYSWSETPLWSSRVLPFPVPPPISLLRDEETLTGG